MIQKHRFSLVELVFLIVVIVILFILLIPMLFTARNEAKAAGCSSNLKQCVNAMLIYGNNSDGWICTYGDKYSGWYAQPGVPESLGFKISKAGRAPITERPVTLCPDSWINASGWNQAQAYGAAWISILPDDYAYEECEQLLQLSTNKGQFIQAQKIPAPSDYVLLADSAYTTGEKANGMIPGIQCILFARRKEGSASYFPRAICLRHQGEANVGYADGHVADTVDRIGMLMKSKIGAYIDTTGQKSTVTK